MTGRQERREYHIAARETNGRGNCGMEWLGQCRKRNVLEGTNEVNKSIYQADCQGLGDVGRKG